MKVWHAAFPRQAQASGAAELRWIGCPGFLWINYREKHFSD